jgi:outer membrane lipoprotein SlyB
MSDSNLHSLRFITPMCQPLRVLASATLAWTLSMHCGANAQTSTSTNTTSTKTQAQAKTSACANCGTVESVNEVKKEGKGSGLGAVGGAVAGGLLGNQFGGGKGKTAMTVAGAAIGCGKHEPSYKDRIGTIDPATAPIVLPGAPAPQKKQR